MSALGGGSRVQPDDRRGGLALALLVALADTAVSVVVLHARARGVRLGRRSLRFGGLAECVGAF